MKSIKEFCEISGIRFLENEPLSNHISFKVGGKCEYMIFPDTEEKIIKSVKYLRESGIKFFVIGNGTNLIAYDEGFDGVILNTSEYISLTINGNTIKCSSGVSLMKICRLALDNSLSGLEFAYGIPGTAGGAAYMNAGAYGGEMKDVLSAGLLIQKEKPAHIPAMNLCSATERACLPEAIKSFFLSL